MDITAMRSLKPQLRRYLKQFDDCFARKDTRSHLPVYIEGQLSDLERKSIEPIALRAGVAVRTLQEFLSQHRWDEGRMRERLQQRVAKRVESLPRIGLIDDTGVAKKGDKTPGVQRQYCGALGKVDNALVTVHLGYTSGEFHCLLDGEVFLPAAWEADRARCREAGIPDEVGYRPKTEMALALYDRASSNGVVFEWLTFDAGYGDKPPFLRALDSRGQAFVGAVAEDYHVWMKAPRVTERTYRRGGRGRRRSTPRLVAGSAPTKPVSELAQRHRCFRDQPWQRFRVKDGEKGPQVWEVKHARVYPPDGDGLPDQRYHLLVARNALDHEEIKYFVSNAEAETPLETLLLVAFSRWRIERCFEDGKGEVGLDHYEGRRWLGLQRHLILSAVSYLFLAEQQQRLGEKTSRTHRVSDSYRPLGDHTGMVVERARLEQRV
jgi:SRSO17 transposase